MYAFALTLVCVTVFPCRLLYSSIIFFVERKQFATWAQSIHVGYMQLNLSTDSFCLVVYWTVRCNRLCAYIYWRWDTRNLTLHSAQTKCLAEQLTILYLEIDSTFFAIYFSVLFENVHIASCSNPVETCKFSVLSGLFFITWEV